MKLGLQLGYWDAKPLDRYIELAQHAERLGFDMVCTAESYGSDVFTPLAVIASRTERIRLGTAVMQISARTPACAAMTAITLDHISEGRLVLGVGVSGPQVVEGWHGQPFERPLQRTREWLAVFRAMLMRDKPVTFEGVHYQLPYRGAGSSQQGKPLMSVTHPRRPNIPVFLGAEGPKNVDLAFTECDGWLPIFFPPERFDLYADSLAKMRPGFEIIMMMHVGLGDDIAALMQPIKRNIALYVGGMGSKTDNFHKRMLERCGYAEAAQKIQDLWYAGQRAEAIAAVPDEFVDSIALIGSREHIRSRLKACAASPATTLLMHRCDTFEQTVAGMEALAAEIL